MGISVDGFPITPYLNSWAYEEATKNKRIQYIARFKSKSVPIRECARTEALRLASFYFRTKAIHQIELEELR
jgi:hypothetical protein